MARILVSGYYGYGNLGDEALLAGLITGLRAKHHSVTVLSSHPETSEKMHGTAAQHRYFSLLPALLSHDVLISGGGGLLQDKSSQRSLDYYLLVIRLAKLLRKKVIIYGQSIGPLSEKGRGKVAKALANTSIAMRDQRSVDLCKTLELKARLVADSALLLPLSNIKSKRQQNILLIPRAGYPDITDTLIQVGQQLSLQNQPLATLALHPEHDLNELNRLKEKLPKCTLLTVNNPHDVLDYVQQAQYVISARLHGLILAAVAGTAFAGLVYDPKVRAFCEEVGAPYYTPPYDTEKLVQDVLNLRSAEEVQLQAMKDRAKQGMAWLNDVIQGSLQKTPSVTEDGAI